MSKGLSLHIGINRLSLEAYEEDGALSSPTNDAGIMAEIAKAEGFEHIALLLNEEATLAAFDSHFDRCIQNLESGDTFLLTFSGHGGQVTDDTGDEEDGKDETWCLYDGCLLDDDLGDKWKMFESGVRIIVVSSSCHSQTALRAISWGGFPLSGPLFPSKKEIRQNGKSIVSAYMHDAAISASILHISACEDEQEARDGDELSKFTGLLYKHWNGGRFTGNYEQLVKCIRSEAGYSQRAGIATLGNNDSALLNSRPFKLLTNKT